MTIYIVTKNNGIKIKKYRGKNYKNKRIYVANVVGKWLKKYQNKLSKEQWFLLTNLPDF